MKILKSNLVLLAVTSLLSLSAVSCQKDDNNPESDKVEGLFYYYSDEANQQIRVIDLNAVSPFRRSYTLSEEVTLEMLAQDRRNS